MLPACNGASVQEHRTYMQFPLLASALSGPHRAEALAPAALSVGRVGVVEIP
jgi:hypothetical protein